MSDTLRTRVAVALLLAALTLAALWPVLGNDFINMDDGTYVVENPRVQAGLTLSGLGWACTTFRASNWHPLTWISHMFDRELFGLHPAGHHATSLALHVLNAVLLFVVLSGATGSLARSGVVAALFAVHPLHVESVAWVAERKDVLSTTLWILTLLAYSRYTRAPSAGGYLLVVLALAGGLMAKPMLVTVPIVLLLLDFWPLGRLETRSMTRWTLIREKILLLALCAASSVVTLVAQHSGGALRTVEEYPLSIRLANAVISYAGYLVKAVWPFGLTIFYPRPIGMPHWGTIAGAAALLVGLTTVAVHQRRHAPYVLVGWLWYVVTLVPVIGVVQVGDQAMADRYTYVPLIGIFVALVWSAARVPLPNGVRIATAVIVLASLAILTRGQVAVWRNAETVFRHAIAVTGENPVALNNLGAALAANGRHADAAELYTAAIGLDPGDAEVHNNLGNALKNLGRLDESLEQYARAVELAPGYANAQYNYGLALARAGRAGEAIERYREALRIDPDLPPAHNNLGSALALQGDIAGAIVHYRKALELQPDYARAHANLASALFFEGRHDEARNELQRARALGFEPPEELIRALSGQRPDP